MTTKLTKATPPRKPTITSNGLLQVTCGILRIAMRLKEVEDAVKIPRTLAKATAASRGDDLAGWSNEQTGAARTIGIDLRALASEAREACTELMAAWKAKSS